MLTPFPPHKTGQEVTPLADRLDLLAAALDDDPAFELCRVDIDRPPPHYAVDTVVCCAPYTRRRAWSISSAATRFPTCRYWHRPADFILACDEIGVMLRPGHVMDLDVLEARLPGLRPRTRLIRAPLLEISSSDLRRKIAQGRPFRYYLPQPVYQLISDRLLYQDG